MKNLKLTEIINNDKTLGVATDTNTKLEYIVQPKNIKKELLENNLKIKSKSYKHISNFAQNQFAEKYILNVCTTPLDTFVLIANNKKVINKKVVKVNSINTSAISNIITMDLAKNNLTNFSKHYKVLNPSHMVYNKPILCEAQKDELLFSNNELGEILYNTKTNKISKTYAFISQANKNQFRIAKNLNSAKLASDDEVGFDIINDNYEVVDTFHNIILPASDFASSYSLKEDAPNIVQGFDNTMYILNDKGERTSRKYKFIQKRNEDLIAVTSSNKFLILNQTGKAVSPAFVELTDLANNTYVLATTKGYKNCVVFDNNSKTIVSEEISNAQINVEYNLVFGDIEIDGEKKSVIFNAANPNITYRVNPLVGTLMLSYLNKKRLSPAIIDKIITNNFAIDSAMLAFNDCMNYNLPKNKQKELNNIQNPCSKFVTKINNSTKHRIKKCEIELTELTNAYNEQLTLLNRKLEKTEKLFNNSKEYASYLKNVKSLNTNLTALPEQTNQEEFEENLSETPELEL